jgi:hypothetical protein
MRLADPDTDAVFWWQLIQVEIAVAASAVEYFPAAHKEHASVPFVVLYRPA